MVSEPKLGGSNAKPDPNLRLLVPPTTNNTCYPSFPPRFSPSFPPRRTLSPPTLSSGFPTPVGLGRTRFDDSHAVALVSGGRCLSVCQDSDFNIERCAPLCLDFNIWTSALKTTFLLHLPLPLPAHTYLYASSVRLHHLLYSLPFEPESGKYWPASEYGREWQMFHAG